MTYCRFKTTTPGYGGLNSFYIRFTPDSFNVTTTTSTDGDDVDEGAYINKVAQAHTYQ